jgi:isoleucyl-tRNA synthetase
MAAVRDVVALGLHVRATHRIRVRQPLAEAILVLGDPSRVLGFEEAIRDELNVRAVRTSDDPAQYVQFTIVPNFRALGPKLGKRMPLCKKALADADGAALHAALAASESFTLELPEGEPVTLGREEVEVRLTEREGYAATSRGDTVVVLDTRITPDLRLEGLAREALNRIQNARKEMDLPYDARIGVTYQASGELAEAIAAHRDWIMGEALATGLVPRAPEGRRFETDVEGIPFNFGIEPDRPVG